MHHITVLSSAKPDIESIARSMSSGGGCSRGCFSQDSRSRAYSFDSSSSAHAIEVEAVSASRPTLDVVATSSEHYSAACGNSLASTTPCAGSTTADSNMPGLLSTTELADRTTAFGTFSTAAMTSSGGNAMSVHTTDQDTDTKALRARASMVRTAVERITLSSMSCSSVHNDESYEDDGDDDGPLPCAATHMAVTAAQHALIAELESLVSVQQCRMRASRAGRARDARQAELLRSQTHALEQQVESMRGEVEELKKHADERSRELIAVEQEADEARGEADSAKADLDRLKEEMRLATIEASELRIELEEEKKQTELWRLATVETKEISMEQKNTVNSLQEQLTVAKQTVDSAQAEAKAEREASEETRVELERVGREIENMKENLQKEREDAQVAREDEKQASARAQQANERILEIEEEISRVCAGAADAELAIHEQKQRIDALELELGEAAALREADRVAIEEASGRADTAEDLLQTAEMDVMNLRSEVENLQDTCTKYASVIALATHHLTEAGPQPSKTKVQPNKTESGPATCTAQLLEEESERGSDQEAMPLGEAKHVPVPVSSNITAVVHDKVAPLATKSADATTAKSSKFQFRVDVPAFEPKGLALPSSSSTVSTTSSAQSEVSQPRSSSRRTLTIGDFIQPCAPNAYDRFFWCPPGTSVPALAKAAHPQDMENCHVVECLAANWMDGACLWADVSRALACIGECVSACPVHDVASICVATKAALVSASAPAVPVGLVLLLREAASLSPSKPVDERVPYAGVVLQIIEQFLDMLKDSQSELKKVRLQVTLVLEGWPAPEKIGLHTARSLSLPRVSRRNGKNKRTQTLCWPMYY